MKILIIGGTGMLGHKLIQFLQYKADLATIIRSADNSLEKFGFYKNCQIFDLIDVRNFNLVLSVIENFRPDVVINAVGIIKQKNEVKDEIFTLDVNSVFPRKLETAALKYGFRLISISTDCVFSGKSGNYSETDIPDSEELYGKSKFLGEVIGENCLTIRTSIIGRELQTKNGLLEWFLNNKDKTVKGYKNAVFSGFPTVVLSEIIWEIIQKFQNLSGLYHISSDPISKFDLLSLVKKEFSLQVEIYPDEEFLIDRSLDSTKFRKLCGFSPESWSEMVKRMAEDTKKYIKWKN